MLCTVKIKGTRAGLSDSAAWFTENQHLTKHVRHIEFWVPVWGDKTHRDRSLDPSVPAPAGGRALHGIEIDATGSLISADELGDFNFKLSTYSSTSKLSEIFQHVAHFFPEACILTLEGGHCKNSNMIHHFPKVLYPEQDRAFQILPNITTFAMRGAWNIVRDVRDWCNIEKALPNLREWHCAYAKPQAGAYNTMGGILLRFPPTILHLNVSFDGFFSKDTASSGSLSSKYHICDYLGRIAPLLETLRYTGKICSCFWIAAVGSAKKTENEPRLRSLEIVAKSCCRPRVTEAVTATGGLEAHEVADDEGNTMIDGIGLTLMSFIRAFERLTVASLHALSTFSLLNQMNIRYVDLESPCPLLNPYFQVCRGRCYGLWNEEILDLLPSIRPGLQYEELGEGLNPVWKVGEKNPDIAIYPKTKPRAIKSSSYQVLANHGIQRPSIMVPHAGLP